MLLTLLGISELQASAQTRLWQTTTTTDDYNEHLFAFTRKSTIFSFSDHFDFERAGYKTSFGEYPGFDSVAH